MKLPDLIASRDARVAVIGLGYVGLPLAVELASAGFHVVGLDVDAARVAQVNAGTSYISDVASSRLEGLVASGRLRASGDAGVLADVDIIDICVPTPLRKTRDPDLSYIVGALEGVARSLRADQLVILESTTYPGTTEEVVRPMLEAGGLRVGRDVFLAFSPERVDPANAQFNTRNIPKVVGGSDGTSTELACAFYGSFIDHVVPVSSTRVAEMVKLLENTFRAVNIGLANEMALMCRNLDIDVWEVIEAAKTKPFGFMPFYPGPGLGGHCIPVDPHYLSWRARQNGFEARFIELASYINASMPAYVVERIADALNSQRKAINGSRIHMFGVSYKRDVGDLRESPALSILESLAAKGARLSYTDPFVPELRHGDLELASVSEVEALAAGVHCAVISTDHSAFDYAAMVARLPLIVDTRNALKAHHAASIFRL